MNQEVDDQAILRWIGKHGVAVIWEDALPNEPNATGGCAFSAMIMSVRGLWFLVTAGHIVTGLHQRQRQGRVLRYAKILDAWGEGAINKMAIPCPDIADEERMPQGFVDRTDVGLDFAWFHLRDYYVVQLRANGIMPLNEVAWDNVPGDIEMFNAFGFPEPAVQEDRDEAGRYRGIKIKAILMPYQQVSIDEVPAGLRSGSESQLFFRPPIGEDGTVQSVLGMSGGPVFGYKHTASGLRKWLVGIQSEQGDKSGLAVVCPNQLFTSSMVEAIEIEMSRRNLSGPKE